MKKILLHNSRQSRKQLNKEIKIDLQNSRKNLKKIKSLFRKIKGSFKSSRIILSKLMLQ